MGNRSDNVIDIENLDALSFDLFGRDPHQDIVCIASARTMVSREEAVEIADHDLNVDELNANPSYPLDSKQITKVPQSEGGTVQARSSQ